MRDIATANGFINQLITGAHHIAWICTCPKLSKTQPKFIQICLISKYDPTISSLINIEHPTETMLDVGDKSTYLEP